MNCTGKLRFALRVTNNHMPFSFVLAYQPVEKGAIDRVSLDGET